MIKFFRKIRQKLLSENKFSKYFIYAIGEIVLVVVGILIALQINNANESWKKDQLKQELYLELKSSIMSDTVALNSEKERLTSAFINAVRLKKTITNDLPYSKSLDSSFAKIEMVRITEADYKTFDRFLEIGIEIIDDKMLMNEIIHYYDDSKNLADNGDKIQKLLTENIYPNYFVSYSYGREAMPEDFEELKKLNSFKIVLDYAIKTSRFLIQRSIHRKNLAIEILKILDDKITIQKGKEYKDPYIKTMEKDSIDIKNEMNRLRKIID
jgi:hypothetical protein